MSTLRIATLLRIALSALRITATGIAALAHLEEVLGVHATHAACHLSHVHAGKTQHGPVAVAGGSAHGVTLGRGEVGGRHARVTHDRSALQVLDGLLVLGVCRNGIDSKSHDLDAAGLSPPLREDVRKRLGDLFGVRRDGGVANAHLGDARERWLQGGEQLASQLRGNLVARKLVLDVSAYVLVEQQRVGKLERELAVAPHGNVHVQTDVVVDHAEGHRRWSAIAVAHDLLGVEVVHALVKASVATKGEALAYVLERIDDARAETARKDGGGSLGVVGELARLGTEVHDLALLDDNHALPIVDHDDRAVRDDVVVTLCVGAARPDALLTLGAQDISIERLAVDHFLPLVGEVAREGTKGRLDECHGKASLLVAPHATPAGRASREP